MRARFLTVAICLSSLAGVSAIAGPADRPGKAFLLSLRIIDATVHAGEPDRASSMLAELRAQYPDDRLGDHERLLIAVRLFRLGRLGEVGQVLQKMAGSKDGALDPIGDEERSEDVEARVAATVLVGHVEEAAELLRQCQQPRPGKRSCGAFKAAGHINAFKRGAMARRLLETLAPTHGKPEANYYTQRAEAELTSARSGPLVALAWARAGLRHHPNDESLLAIAADTSLRAGRWADLVDMLFVIAANKPNDKHAYLSFTKRTGIAPWSPQPPPEKAQQPPPKAENTSLSWLWALAAAAMSLGVIFVVRQRR